MSFSDTDVQGALKNLIDPNTKKDFVSGKSVKNIKVRGSDVSLDIMLGYPAKSVWEEIRALVEAHLKESLSGTGTISVNVTSRTSSLALIRRIKRSPFMVMDPSTRWFESRRFTSVFLNISEKHSILPISSITISMSPYFGIIAGTAMRSISSRLTPYRPTLKRLWIA